MYHLRIISIIHTSRNQVILLLILPLQVPAQKDDDAHEEGVAAKMGGEGDEVVGCVPGEEDLWA